MAVFTKSDFEAGEAIVYDHLQPTLQHNWPLLGQALGCSTWVKHENQTPLGAFKVRGGLVHLARRIGAGKTGGVITASTGNHGQSIPFAASKYGVDATVVVPKGNSRSKNNAMRALGARLVEHGSDFVDARNFASDLARKEGLDMIPSFHSDLIVGVATYAAELFAQVNDLDRVYVPIGLGSGICGVIGMRNLLGLKTKVIGVVAQQANAYEKSFKTGNPTSTNSATTFAEGVAVRETHPDAVSIINAGAEDVIAVSEDLIADAVRVLFDTTQNVAEGAGAVAVAGALAQRDQNKGEKIGVVLSGGNIDRNRFINIMEDEKRP